jgi:TonB family protein
MRIICILLFSFFLHFMIFSIDNYLFPPGGKSLQTQKISYAIRSIDSFRPLAESAVALPLKQVVQEADLNKSVKKNKIEKTISKPQLDKIMKKVSSDKPIKAIEHHQAIAEDLAIADMSSEDTDDAVKGDELEKLQQPVPEIQASEEAHMIQPTDLMPENPIGVSERVDGQSNEEILTNSKIYQSALPRYDINPRPEYPRVARTRGWEGVVLFDVLVRKDGRVGRMKMLSSSGYRSLDSAAKKVLRRWKFVPATTLGVPVESQVTVPIMFSLQSL